MPPVARPPPVGQPSSAQATAGHGTGVTASLRAAVPTVAASTVVSEGLGSPGAGQAAAAAAAGSTCGPGPGAAAQVDADGFTVVARGRKGAGHGGTASGSSSADPCRVTAASAMHVDEGDAGMATETDVETVAARPTLGGVPARGDDALEDDGGADDGDDDGADEPPADLKRRMDEEVAMVKWLEREGVAPEHPSMRAALAARDAAENAWRAARSPQPVGKRMGWAQARLDRALRQQGKVVQELAIFDSEVKAQREKIGERLLAARARVSKQREALEALQEEAASLVQSSDKRGRGRQVCSRVADGITATVAPHIMALAATIPEGSAAAAKLQELMGQIDAIQVQLRSVAEEGDGKHGSEHPAPRAPHQRFDIADGATSEAWSESHELDGHADVSAVGAGGEQGQQTETHWHTRGFGRWSKAADSGAATVSAVALGGGPSALGVSASLAAEQAMPPPRAATRGRAQDSATPQGAAAGGAAGGDRDGHDQSAEPPAAKSRKGQTAEDSEDAAASVLQTRRAVEDLAQQAAATSAAAGSMDATALARHQAQLHASAVAAVTNQAIAQGVQPVTEDGADLIVLGAEELARWAAENLQAEAFW